MEMKPDSDTKPRPDPLHDAEKEMVLLVRNSTGCGILDAKKALIAHNWDVSGAIRHVRATCSFAMRMPGAGPCSTIEDDSDVQDFANVRK